MNINKLSIVFFTTITIIIQFIGRYFSSSGMAWYNNLNLPNITPPGWVFAVAWTTIYFLTALCAIITWNYYREYKNLKNIMYLFGINAFLNLFWSYQFFFLHRIFSGLVIAILLEVSVLLLIFMIFKISKKTSFLLIPYAIWGIFAIILNYLVWVMNK